MASLARTTLLSGFAVAVRLASALAINKILAVYVGPAGYGLIGQMQSVTAVLAGLNGGLLATGVTKGTAEHFDDEARQRALWRTAARLSLWSTAASIAVLLAVSGRLGEWLFGRSDLSHAFLWLALALPAMSANALMLAILNGRKQLHGYLASGIAGSVLGLVATAALASAFGLAGALVAVAIGPALALIVSGPVARRKVRFGLRDACGRVDAGAARHLAAYAAMALATVICAPLAHMLIRDHLGQAFGWASAGHWHAMMRMSEVYLAVITMTLGLYFLPRVAEIRQPADLAREIAKVYRYAVPLAAAAALSLYLLREPLVLLLFTAEFAPMKELFAWQVAGDVVRVASWILGYVLMGRGATAAFIVAEVLSATAWVLLAWGLTPRFGPTGAVMGYLATYVLYWSITAIFVRRLVRAPWPHG
jgi:PST family polysaccharide transporter